MDTEPPVSLYDRLGKLEGMMLGIQTSITQSQNHFAGYASRIDGLEKRQIELERQMITRADLANLMQKIDVIAEKQSSQEGGSEATRWSLQQIVSWAALLVALLTAVSGITQANKPQPQYPHALERR